MRGHLMLALGACSALVVSAGAIDWLRRSSEHVDRPPLFAIAALLVAVLAGVLGLVLCVRLATRVLRHPPSGTE